MHTLRWWQKGMVGVSLGVLAFLYVPIVILVIFSFNDSKVTSFPLAGFTLHWYEAFLANGQMLKALWNSLFVALFATLLSVVIGVTAALALDRYDFPGKRLFQNAVLLPLSLPGIVTGIAMLNFYRQIGIPQSLTAVIIGHATALLGVVVSQVMARLAKINRRQFEASADLGATPVETFRRVTLPAIRSSIIGSALLCFTLSFDEIPVTYFLTGREVTLPIYIYSTLRRGITPEINAIGTLIVAASFILIILSVTLLRERKHV
ncbi:spermidine/putrescine transport system permease protein [Pseudoxanthobacter soli DSM 19599]|uniref:Spermidine/putrescine transport system permease protein n=1 Tax=Pseudoxanthobacter soli DSM 19599 TaxID=1123029 RepID=A0A1M7ZIS0_9HYPH|nr:ABC transporter permease [Pseudoxanthobacter soli]SHO64773.1 spermidine/putrescine transport system permease protein [Pseudoxanthobacter soli DSM 19599]